jgi:transmembrane sensor
MNRHDDPEIGDAAAAWFAAQDTDDTDWDGFTTWLEADPRHRAAIDALAAIDHAVAQQRAAIGALLPHEPQAQSPDYEHRRAPNRWRWAIGAGGAIAAALAVALALPEAASDRSWTSDAGVRQVALSNGVSATLAPHSRLVARGGDVRELALNGSAFFDVAHDPARTLRITAGAIEVRDIGTRFEVTGAGGDARVAVAEGQVSVGSAGLDRPVTLAAGHALVAHGDTVTLAPVDRGDVARWRQGQLVYDQAPLSLVASDVARYTGRPVTVDPRIADRRFSGVLTIGDGQRLAKDVASIAGVAVRSDRTGVRLEPNGR